MTAAPPTVLLALRDLPTQASTAAALDASGFRARTFLTAAALLDALSDGAACAVIDLPDQPADANTLLERARAHDAEARVPMVVIAGLERPAALDAEITLLTRPVDEPGIVDAVRAAVARASMTGRRERLTRREYEVCLLVADGMSDADIAATLGMSAKTVKVHRGRAMKKLQAHSAADLKPLLNG
jgi:FixJ family two-component response regulator